MDIIINAKKFSIQTHKFYYKPADESVKKLITKLHQLTENSIVSGGSGLNRLIITNEYNRIHMATTTTRDIIRALNRVSHSSKNCLYYPSEPLWA